MPITGSVEDADRAFQFTESWECTTVGIEGRRADWSLSGWTGRLLSIPSAPRKYNTPSGDRESPAIAVSRPLPVRLFPLILQCILFKKRTVAIVDENEII